MSFGFATPGVETVVMLLGLHPRPNTVGRFRCGCYLAIHASDSAASKASAAKTLCFNCYLARKAARAS